MLTNDPDCPACYPAPDAVGIIYHVHNGRYLCPCCGLAQPPGSAIAYCDACNTDTCGHHDYQRP